MAVLGNEQRHYGYLLSHDMPLIYPCNGLNANCCAGATAGVFEWKKYNKVWMWVWKDGCPESPESCDTLLPANHPDPSPDGRKYMCLFCGDVFPKGLQDDFTWSKSITDTLNDVYAQTVQKPNDPLVGSISAANRGSANSTLSGTIPIKHNCIFLEYTSMYDHSSMDRCYPNGAANGLKGGTYTSGMTLSMTLTISGIAQPEGTTFPDLLPAGKYNLMHSQSSADVYVATNATVTGNWPTALWSNITLTCLRYGLFPPCPLTISIAEITSDKVKIFVQTRYAMSRIRIDVTGQPDPINDEEQNPVKFTSYKDCNQEDNDYQLPQKLVEIPISKEGIYNFKVSVYNETGWSEPWLLKNNIVRNS